MRKAGRLRPVFLFSAPAVGAESERGNQARRGIGARRDFKRLNGINRSAFCLVKIFAPAYSGLNSPLTVPLGEVLSVFRRKHVGYLGYRYVRGGVLFVYYVFHPHNLKSVYDNINYAFFGV